MHLRKIKPGKACHGLLPLAACAVAAVAVFLHADAAPSAVASENSGDEPILVSTDREGLAIQGYDPVAYFTKGVPTKGDARFQTVHFGGIYRFSSAENKEMFDGNPGKYAPAFGGYCGYAASINRLSPISPEWFQVIEGRLILQHNKKAFDLWNKDLEGNLVKADGYWPGLVAKNGSRGRSLLQLDKKGVALGGCDPIGYFVDGKPVKGDPSIYATFGGAIYHFASQQHRETFEKDPAKYVPAYGGFCGYAASIGKVRPADPLLWSIVDGRLIVQHTKGAVELWEKDVAGNKSRADRFWPRLVELKAGKKDPIDSLFASSVLPEAR